MPQVVALRALVRVNNEEEFNKSSTLLCQCALMKVRVAIGE